MANTCKDINSRLLLYMNKRLSADEVSEVVSHLATCKDCRREIAGLILVKKELSKTVGEIPSQIKKQVFNKLYEQEKEELVSTGHIAKDVSDLFTGNMPSLNIGSRILALVVSPLKNTFNILDYYKGGQKYVRS